MVLLAAFSADDVTAVVGQEIQFTDSSTDAISWLWGFGDGLPGSVIQNATHTYMTPGEYTVTLTVGDGMGFDDEVKVAYITVTAVAPVPETPIAAFSSDVQVWETPVVVTFTDASTNQPTTRWRDFGDGFFSNLQNPVHTYYLPGKYTVSLKITNITWIDEEIKVDYLEFVETDDGLTNLENLVEGRRGTESFPPLQEKPVEIDDRIIIKASGENIPLTGNELINE